MIASSFGILTLLTLGISAAATPFGINDTWHYKAKIRDIIMLIEWLSPTAALAAIIPVPKMSKCQNSRSF